MSNRADTQGWLKDGSAGFSGGVDSSRLPSDIDRDQVAFAVNTTMRGGYLSPRPGWRKLAVISAAANNARFQHGAFYDGNGVPSLLSSIGGKIFKLDLSSLNISDISPIKTEIRTTTASFTVPAVGASASMSINDTTGIVVPSSCSIGGFNLSVKSITNSTTIVVYNYDAASVGNVVASPATVNCQTDDKNDSGRLMGWSQQAENYWIYQDNQSLPVIFDGSTSRRSNPAEMEVPVGNVMAYTMGRLVVALRDRQTFRIGDILFGPSGKQVYGYKDAILKFTENSYLNEGGDLIARVFGAPSNGGIITAMKACSMSDAQLGQGPLIVGTPLQVFTVNLPFDRTTWKNMANALQTVNPVIGPLGQNSSVLINADLWYRSIDGIRSYIMAQRQFQTWGNTPMSSEIDDLLSYDTPELAEFSSAALFDNRLMMTCSPVPSDFGVWHRGIVVMDLNLVSGVRKKVPPAWEGVWTGFRILQLIKGVVNSRERCFAFILDSNNDISVYELSLEAKLDNDTTQITWSQDYPSYNCGNSDQFKRLETARIVATDLTGNLSGRVLYRSDLSPTWQQWDSFNVCAVGQDCKDPGDCLGPHTYALQVRNPIRLRMPTDDICGDTGRMWRTGYEFQPRIELTGWARIRQIRIYAKDEPEALGTDNKDSMDETCSASNSTDQFCGDNPFSATPEL